MYLKRYHFKQATNTNNMSTCIAINKAKSSVCGKPVKGSGNLCGVHGRGKRTIVSTEAVVVAATEVDAVVAEDSVKVVDDAVVAEDVKVVDAVVAEDVKVVDAVVVEDSVKVVDTSVDAPVAVVATFPSFRVDAKPFRVGVPICGGFYERLPEDTMVPNCYIVTSLGVQMFTMAINETRQRVESLGGQTYNVAIPPTHSMPYRIVEDPKGGHLKTVAVLRRLNSDYYTNEIRKTAGGMLFLTVELSNPNSGTPEYPIYMNGEFYQVV
jgi:hypothetical protein